MSDLDCTKPIFIADLTRWHKDCVAKSSYLKKVVEGGEVITMQIVSRCRESLLQFNQSHYVFNSLKDTGEITFTGDELNKLEAMAAEIDQFSIDAKKHWNAIIAWIPVQDMPKPDAE